MDSFFASVEVLDDPSLAGRPVIVGGAGARGVVASCTYEARAFGIHSAMPSVEARRRCPHAVFLPGRFARYVGDERAPARRAPAVLTGGRGHLARRGVRRRRRGTAASRARLPRWRGAIRQAVRDDLAMECGVGVARTKLIAKLASRAAKPVLDPRRGPARARGLRGPPRRGAVVPPPPAGPCPVGRGARHRPAPRRPGGRRPSASWPRIPDGHAVPFARHRQRAPARASWPGARTPGAVEANREAKSVGHEETFALDIAAHDGLHRHVRAHGRRGGDAPARGAAWRGGRSR